MRVSSNFDDLHMKISQNYIAEIAWFMHLLENVCAMIWQLVRLFGCNFACHDPPWMLEIVL